MFNAIPIVPLDGGYMMKEGVERLFERLGWSQQYAQRVVASISGFVTVMLILLITMPLIGAAVRSVLAMG
jgi:membrane-associated protease RseP (regulator of RpoE activity)